jgi:hypothetical protein
MQPSIYGHIRGALRERSQSTVSTRRCGSTSMSGPTRALADRLKGIDRARLKAQQRAFMQKNDGMHADPGTADATFSQVVSQLAATLNELSVDEAVIGEIAAGWRRCRPKLLLWP